MALLYLLECVSRWCLLLLLLHYEWLVRKLLSRTGSVCLSTSSCSEGKVCFSFRAGMFWGSPSDAFLTLQLDGLTLVFFSVLLSRIPMTSRPKNTLYWIQFAQYSSEVRVNSSPSPLEESLTTLLLGFISPVSLLMAHGLKLLDTVPCPNICVPTAKRILLGISLPVMMRLICNFLYFI